MKTQGYRTLGYKDVQVQTPETVEEFNENAGVSVEHPNPCLEEATSNIVWRSTLQAVRAIFLHGEEADVEKGIVASEGIEQLTGIERITKHVKGKDGKVRMKDGEPVTAYDESEEEYFDRVIAKLVEDGKFSTEEAARESFRPLMDKIAAGVKFDASPSARTVKAPKKLAFNYKFTAARLLSAGAHALKAFNDHQLSKIGKSFVPYVVPEGEEVKTFNATGEVNGKTLTVNVSDRDAETLGWLIKEWSSWNEKQQLGAIGGV